MRASGPSGPLVFLGALMVNAGQICAGLEADKLEIFLETCPFWKTYGQRSGLQVIDEQNAM